FFQAEDGIRDRNVTGVQTCALPISLSNQLARTLKAAGCERGDRVCFLLPKSPLAIVSMLGILKADCIYIPVDPSSPAPRVAKIEIGRASCRERVEIVEVAVEVYRKR